jgi:hypothetical protein
MARTALLLVGLAVGLLLSACATAQPSIDLGDPVGAQVPFRCPDSRAEPSTVADHRGDSLPTGARAALLCVLDNHVPWAAPRGELTSGLDRLVREVNAQKMHDPASPEACGGVGAPTWSMVFRYAGGTRTITGDNGGCWDLRVGSTERMGSRAVFETYLHAKLRQHAREQPRPFHATPPSCPPRVNLAFFAPAADPSTARVGAVCVLEPHSNRTAGRFALAGAQLGVLRRDLATASQRRVDGDALSSCSNDRALVARGLDAWREPFDVYVECGAYRILQPASVRYSFASLLPRTARMLAGVTHP